MVRSASMEELAVWPARADTDTDERMQALVRAHGAALYRLLLRLTSGERQAAEDLMQETLVRAWKYIDQLHSDVETLRPWLFTVARRIAIDAGRAKRTRPTEVGMDDMTVMASQDTAIDQLVDRHTIMAALMSVSEDHRRVILEIYFRGRSVSEVAELLHIPEGTVKSRTYYALRALRDVIESGRKPSGVRAASAAPQSDRGGSSPRLAYSSRSARSA